MQTDNWYVLHVLTGKEQDVLAAALQLEGVEAFVPSHLLMERTVLTDRSDVEWVEVPHMLFPGYVFVRVDRMDARRYYQFKRIMGVIRILGFADGDIPRPIPVNEMERLLEIGFDVVGVSTGERVNGKVKVKSGPLLGLKDYITSIDARQCRATVELDLLGRKHVFKLALKVESPSSQDAPEAE